MSAYKIKIYLTFSNNWLENVVGKKKKNPIYGGNKNIKCPEINLTKNVQDKMKKSTK